MASYEGERALALLYKDCEGCTYFQTAIEEAIQHAQQGFGEPITSNVYPKGLSEGHGVCECKNVGVTVYMAIMPGGGGTVDEVTGEGVAREFHGQPIITRIEVTNLWWTRCAVLNQQ